MSWIKVIVFTGDILYANPKAEKKKRKKTGMHLLLRNGCYVITKWMNYEHRLNEKEDEERRGERRKENEK